jgi:hypothetical protein
MSNSARTLAAMADYHLFLSLDAPDLYATPTIRPSISGPPMKQLSYSEHEAKEYLLTWGIPCLSGTLVSSVAGAIDAARTFDGPVAMKLQSREVPHKTEIGGVALGLCDDAAIGHAFDMMMTAVKRKVPNAKIQGVRIEPMASVGEEILVGVTTEPGFSPILTLGSGGILVELINDENFFTHRCHGLDANTLDFGIWHLAFHRCHHHVKCVTDSRIITKTKRNATNFCFVRYLPGLQFHCHGPIKCPGSIDGSGH